MISDFLSLLNHEFSITGFSETWFNDHMSPLIQLDNYTLLENHRNSRRGGGTCLFISKKLSFVNRSDISFFDSEIESTFIEINNLSADMKNCIVGVVYRPTRGSVSSFNDYIKSTTS